MLCTTLEPKQDISIVSLPVVITKYQVTVYLIIAADP